MAEVVRAAAYCNNEVAFLAWDVKEPIAGCLGFEIMRQYLDLHGAVTETVPLAAYVAFKGQSNPDWKPQNTSVWPVQKFSWRDLTLRKRRDRAERRPDEVTVQYTIRPVGKRRDGLEPVNPRREGRPPDFNTYQGEPLPLSYLGPGTTTNRITVTRKHGPFESTFTSGILSGQWLVKALKGDDDKILPGELKGHLVKSGDPLRRYLAGDVPPLVHAFFEAHAGGRFHMALYELEDTELEKIIADNADRIDLILSNTGPGKVGDDTGDEDDGAAGKVWDARNNPARARLIKRAAKRGTKFRLQHRMFNNSVQIGHNKFVVWVDDDGVARAVVTGSTNWTWSGLTAQSNNAIRIDDDTIAAAYLDYWQRMKADAIPLPDPLGAAMGANQQGQKFRHDNVTSHPAPLPASAAAEVWFSPNTVSRKYGAHPETPPDLDRVFSLMRKAKRAIFFLAFYPSVQGKNSIIEEAVNLGLKDKSLIVVGAVSSGNAMFNFKPKSKTASGQELPADAPFVYQKNSISVVRAAAITDRQLLRPLGDFHAEILKAGNAIIHDKILVIDPLDAASCTVVFGSHNFGFKASYSNDENMVIVAGQQELALAYTVHILDVYDHYRFRAAESELRAKGKPGWDGFLDTSDAWQSHAGKMISGYFAR